MGSDWEKVKTSITSCIIQPRSMLEGIDVLVNTDEEARQLLRALGMPFRN